MKKKLKLYSLFFIFLSMLASLFIGISIAIIIGAGKNQGLAGGAIILGYGMVASIVALVLSLFINYRLEKQSIIFINKALFCGIVIFSIGFTLYYFLNIKPNRKIETKESLIETTVRFPHYYYSISNHC